MPRQYDEDDENPYGRQDDFQAPQRERFYRRERDEEGSRRRGHSVVGILSLSASLLALILIFVLIVVAGVMSATQGGLPDDSPQAILIGLGIFTGIGLTILGLILGLVGLFQKNSNKVFAILGTCLNGLILLGTLALMCLGLLLG